MQPGEGLKEVIQKACDKAYKNKETFHPEPEEKQQRADNLEFKYNETFRLACNEDDPEKRRQLTRAAYDLLQEYNKVMREIMEESNGIRKTILSILLNENGK